MANPYTLGRGKLYFQQEDTTGYRYIGNTPELNLSVTEEKLEHYGSDEGIREKDLVVPLTANRTGSFITDSVKLANIALFFFGSVSAINQIAAPAQNEEFASVAQDTLYQLGVTSLRPEGYRGVENVVAYDAVDPSPVFMEGTDYTVDEDAGAIYVIDGGGIMAGITVEVDYDVRAATFDRVLSGSTAINGSLRYLESNAEGPDKVFFFPTVTLSPNGDFALKGDELQQIPFTLEILKPTGQAAVYCDGVPVYA